MKHPILLTTLVVLPLVIGGIIYDRREKINVLGVRKDSVSQSVTEALRGEAKTEGLTFRELDGADDSGEPESRREEPMTGGETGGLGSGETAETPMPPREPAPPPAEPAKLVLYFGESCPHCVKVSEFIKQNRIAELTGIVEKEVFKDKQNATEAVAAARACGITDESKMGVPMLVAEGRCLIGQDDVISYLKARAGI